MNKHFFRVVFSKARGCLVVASELAKASGKGKRSAAKASAAPALSVSSYSVLALSVLMAQGGLMLAVPAHADIVADAQAPASQRPTLLRTDNGTPQIDIQTPSAAGVSHNKYTAFNVGKEGVILNNARTPANTNLAGFVNANPWLARGEARVILNEVRSPSASELQGFVEVAGQKADVIIANPAGITCNGCGFINADRATLSTGTPIMNGGRLEGFNVERGTVSIEGQGLNAAGSDFTSLIARAVEVNADILAQDLSVVTGRNRVAANSTVESTSTDVAADAPNFAIDVAQLGGMYAGKIHLVATEAGVGVNNAGTLAATSSSLTLSADGKLVNKGQITANTNIAVNTTGDTENSGTLYAQNTTTILAANLTNSGTLAAQNATVIDVQADIVNTAAGFVGAGINSDVTLADSGELSLKSANLTNQGRMVSAGNTSAEQTTDITNTGTLVARQKTTIEAERLTNVPDAVIQSGELDVELENLSNSAQLSADSLTLKARQITNTATGAITADTVAIDTTDQSSGAAAAVTETVDNQGRIYAFENLQMDTDGDLTNANLIAANNNAVIDVEGTLDNQTGALIGGGITNELAVGATGSLTLDIEGDANNKGQIIAAQTLTADIAGTLTNERYIQARDTASVTANDIVKQAGAEITANNVAVTSTTSLENRGLINGLNTTVAADQVKNIGEGKVYGTDLRIQTRELTNTGENDVGATIAARSSLKVGAETILNEKDASLLSLGDLTIGRTVGDDGTVTGSAQQLDNIGADIEAHNDLLINAEVINNRNSDLEIETVTLIDNQFVREYQRRGSSSRQTSKPSGDYTVYEYNVNQTEERIKSSNPGRMVSGGDLTINARTVLNDHSEILAGADLDINADDLDNIDTELQNIKTGSGTSYYSYISKCGKFFDLLDESCRKNTSTSPYTHPTETITTIAGLAKNLENQGAITSGTTIGLAGAPVPTQSGQVTQHVNGISLPTGSLFNNTGEDVSRPLFESDPRFTDYRTWLNASYLLGQVVYEPHTTQRMLGDGYVQQLVVQQQITQLTGNRFLPGYNSNEEQYMALMDAGVNFALEYDLVPGVALTSTQMSQLTSDMVWLVDQDVQLADGSVQTVLVPQVYAVLEEGDLNGSGAVLGGQNIDINLAGLMHNTGKINAASELRIDVENVENVRGVISGEDVQIQAGQQIANLGGNITAGQRLDLRAGGDITVAALERVAADSNGGNFFETVTLDGIGTLTVTNPNASMFAAAGGDFNLEAGALEAEGENSQIDILAQNDINIDPATVRQRSATVWDSRNFREDSASADIGSAIAGNADVNLTAGNDIEITAANIEIDGDLTATAGGNIDINAGEKTLTQYEDHYGKGGGLLAKTSRRTIDQIDNSDVLGTQISAQSVNVAAGNNLQVSGSSIVADNNVELNAVNDIDITSAQGRTASDSFEETKKSGIFGGGDFGITIGSRKKSEDIDTDEVHQIASVIGSLDGDISINAGNDLEITASDLLARSGNVRLEGDNVTLESAEDEYLRREEHRVSQSGLTLAISGGVVDQVKTVATSAKRITDAKDGRLKAVNAWRAGRVLNDIGDSAGSLEHLGKDFESPLTANTEGQGQSSGINISLSLGSSKSTQTQTVDNKTALGSSVIAKQDIDIVARGDDARDTAEQRTGDILTRGALLEAENINLNARDEIQLLSAENTTSDKSTSKSSSAGIGISFGSDGLQFFVEGSKSRGLTNQTSDKYLETQLNANNQVNIVSGDDTTLKGAQVNAEKIVADIGGDLNIISEQDEEHYKKRNKSIGGRVGVGIGGSMVNVSVNYSDLKADSEYVAVQEQSGLFAGEEGFDVQVGGNTDLQGGAIVSEADADKNRLSTETLTYNSLQNKAEYDVKSKSISFSTSSSGGLQGVGGGFGNDSGDASNTTYAAISEGDIEVRANPGQSLENIKRSREEAHQVLERIFSEDKVTAVEEQVELTQLFAEEAYLAVGNLYEDLESAEHALQAAIDADASPDKIARLRVRVQEEQQKLPIDKSVAHAIVGGLTATLGGGNFIQGAVAAGVNETVATEIQEELKNKPLLQNLASVLIGGAIGGQSGALITGNANLNNRQLHPTEIEFIEDPERVERYLALRLQNGEALTYEQALNQLKSIALQLVDLEWEKQLGTFDENHPAVAFLQQEGIGKSYLDSFGESHALFSATPDERKDETINLEHYSKIREQLKDVLPEATFGDALENLLLPVAAVHGVLKEVYESGEGVYEVGSTVVDPETYAKIQQFKNLLMNTRKRRISS